MSFKDNLVSIAPILTGATIAAILQARESQKKSRWVKVVDFFVDSLIGSSTAYFLAGWAIDYFNQTTPNAVMAIGFLFGAVGVQLIRWTIKDGLPYLLEKLGVKQ